MSNAMTGDYDLVAQFSVESISRILAAMHRGERFPHSMSIAVDDLPTSHLGAVAVSVVDRFGKAIADVARVKQVAYAAPAAGGFILQEVIRIADPVVNWRSDPTPSPAADLKVGNFQPQQNPHVVGSTDTYSYLAGVAQLQLSPPIMSLLHGETNIAAVHTLVMIRYHANDGTLPLSEFMRGDIITTFSIALEPGRNGTSVVVKPSNIHFNPLWSATPLSAEDNAAIDKALAKSLKQSFQSSSTPVPANMRNLNFKAFSASGLVCVMMNVISNNNPSPDSVNTVLLERGSDFILAVSADTIVPPFVAAVNAAIDPFREQHLDTTVVIHYGLGTYTFHIYTNITVLSATVQLVDNPALDLPGIPGKGQIVLQIPVQVRFGWKDKPFFVPDPVDFDFSMVQTFTLTLNGREVGLQRLGDVAVVIPNNVPADEKNNATTNATNLFNSAWNANQAQIQQQINQALSADSLQSFIKSLMNPKTPVSTSSLVKSVFGAPTASSATPQEVDPDLEYLSFQISPDGILLTGSLSVPPWPDTDVEFEKDPWASAASPEYRALNSWIPGGVIQQYHWIYPGIGTQTDPNRFITVNAPVLLAYTNQICLTITGLRISNSGPSAYDAVNSVQQCKLTSIPLGGWKDRVDWSAANRPQIVVPKPRPSPDAGIEVLAHASPWAPSGMGGGTANLLVHFPDDSSAGNYDFLTRGLVQSGRSDTVTATLCVLTPQQLSTARSAGIMYADDSAAWERLLEIHKRPTTALLDPTGTAVWRHEGKITSAELAQVLRDRLSPGGQFFPQFLDSPLQAGQLAPNFLLEDVSGGQSTLRMLAGRPVALIFWRSASSPALSTIKHLREAASRGELENLVIVAVNDGGDAKSLPGEALGPAFSVVPDPARQISRAYGVSIWPTLVFLDSSGLIRDVRFGLISQQDLHPTVASKLLASSATRKEA